MRRRNHRPAETANEHKTSKQRVSLAVGSIRRVFTPSGDVAAKQVWVRFEEEVPGGIHDACVFRPNVTGNFGVVTDGPANVTGCAFRLIVTDRFGIVTGHFGRRDRRFRRS